jgi:hypothetical protein
MAVWLPDRLIANFVPTCPHCKSNRHVDVIKARWQNSPKVLFGLKGHKYLDTKLYPCHQCKRQFTGYNPESMKEDAHYYAGFFNYHLSGRFADDEELYSFVRSQYDVSPPRIFNALQQMAVDTYLNDFSLYLHAVWSKRVKNARGDVTAHNPTRRTLDSSLAGDKMTPTERTVRSLQNELRSKRMALLSAEQKVLDRVCFKDLRHIKKGRNANDVVLERIGWRKLDELMDCGIMNAKELMDYPGVPDFYAGNRDKVRTFERYRAKAAELFAARKRVVGAMKNEITNVEEQLAAAKAMVAIDLSVEVQMVRDGEAEEREYRPLLFSKMTEKDGYNARILSHGLIEQLLMTDFLQRKPIQQAKMMGLSSQVLKLDFEYKVVKKIHVYTGVGKAFRPYKCLATVQNENNQTVYWKVCQGSESIDKIETGLGQLKERNKDTIKVIYVDNCCTVREKLTAISEGTLVKLDPFHFFKRWDLVLFDSNSKEADLFRGLLCRAVFCCDNVEYQRALATAKAKLVRRGKVPKPTHRQIMQEARTVMPPKDVLEANAMAVIQNCLTIDFNIELKCAVRDDSDTSVLPKPFFKSMSQYVGGKGRTKNVDKAHSWLTLKFAG